MAVQHSRTAEPIGDRARTAAMGTWGLWLTLTVLATFVAGLAAAALYLHTGQEAWPPPFLEPPSGLPATVAVVLSLLGAFVAHRARATMGAERRRSAAIALAAAVGLHTAATVTLIAHLWQLPFPHDAHAYASVYWILTGFAAWFLGVSVLVLLGVLVQTLVGLVDPDRHLELTNAAIHAWFASASAVVLLALVHLLPATGGGG